jgi:hypothetical protein
MNVLVPREISKELKLNTNLIQWLANSDLDLYLMVLAAGLARQPRFTHTGGVKFCFL